MQKPKSASKIKSTNPSPTETQPTETSTDDEDESSQSRNRSKVEKQVNTSTSTSTTTNSTKNRNKQKSNSFRSKPLLNSNLIEQNLTKIEADENELDNFGSMNENLLKTKFIKDIIIASNIDEFLNTAVSRKLIELKKITDLKVEFGNIFSILDSDAFNIKPTDTSSIIDGTFDKLTSTISD